MTELEGRWAALPNGRVVRIVAVDGESVIAETPAGHSVERPVAHVVARWELLTDDSLLVLAERAPDILRSRIAEDPVGLVADAIRDLGGDAETAEIRRYLERVAGQFIGTGDAFREWWRRIQPRLGDDPRIDDTRSLERRYGVLAPGEPKPIARRPLVSNETRNGRRLAFAPVLKAARERARGAKDLPDEDLTDLRRIAALGALPELDPTDRFMAAELGSWIALQPLEEAITLLGEDLLALDLLRVPQKASRAKALAWLERWLAQHADDWRWAGSESPATLASALAAGADLSAELGPIAARLGVAQGAIVEGAVAWAFPGSEESKPWKLPADYDAYLARLNRLRHALAAADASVLSGMERGALTALLGLAGSDKHDPRTMDVERTLAEVATGARVRLSPPNRAPSSEIARLPGRRFEALMQVRTGSGGGWVRHVYQDAVELAFARDPDEYRGVLRLYASLAGEDPGAVALRVARRVLHRDRVATIAVVGSELAVDSEVRAACDALAGTTLPDDPRVQAALEAVAEETAEALLDGSDQGRSVMVFTQATWSRFGARMAAQIAEHERRRREAEAAADLATRELDVARSAAEQSRASLAASRASGESQRSVSAARMVANVLKPVAAALADSLEAPSLEALQDRLVSVLERARIEPILGPDEIQPFDPDRHRWVGEGAPSPRVVAVSPGFIANLEGEHAIVIVPARVVAAPEA